MATEKITVYAIKGFDNEGAYAKRFSPVEATEQRVRELERNGLISREKPAIPTTAEKAAPRPKNKKAPDPGNKAKS